MSMGMALLGTRDYLRTALTWTKDNIGIQHNNLPPNAARNWYVALDDGGVEGTPQGQYYLKEIFSITVGIWRRPGRLPQDVSGAIMLPDDIYVSGIETLNDLERKIIKKLHNNYALMASINTQFSLPSATVSGDVGGDVFGQEPLIYRGRTKNEVVSIPGTTDAQAWFGRRLNFRGLSRTQYINAMG